MFNWFCKTMEDDLEEGDLGSIHDFFPSALPVAKSRACLAWDWEAFSGESVNPRDFRKIPEPVIMKYRVFESLSPPEYLQRFGNC